MTNQNTHKLYEILTLKSIFWVLNKIPGDMDLDARKTCLWGLGPGHAQTSLLRSEVSKNTEILHVASSAINLGGISEVAKI